MKYKLIVCTVLAALFTGGAIWATVRPDEQPASTPTPTPAIRSTVPVIQLNVTDQAVQQSADSGQLTVSIKSARFDVISKVDYLLNGNVVASSQQAPYAVNINLAGLGRGTHQLQARATDTQGRIGLSEVFRFQYTPKSAVQPASQAARAIVRQSQSAGTPAKLAVSQPPVSDSGNDSVDSGEDSPVDTTPWPDEPPAQICGNNAILGGGPASAPAGAIVVPAGDNSAVDFQLDNATYWFASGVHTLGTGQFDQIIPGDNTRFVGAPGAILDGQNLNNYAFTQHAVNVTVEYLTIRNFITPHNEGTVNHDSGTGWTIQYNTVHDNGGGGVFLGSDNILRYNCLRDNGQYGFQVYSSAGPQNVLLEYNEISGNNTDDWETAVPGCGCTGGGKFWEATGVTIRNNYVHDNLSVGLWADTNDNDFLIEGNYIADNDGQAIFYEISYNMIVRNNNFLRNAHVGGQQNAGFPTGAIYLSESGGDARVPARTANIEIYDNNFQDNWAGVVLWENADRFCSSPANTSSGTCTLVNPDANLTTCTDPASGGSVNAEPYYSDCRWKTQNVKVHDNIFSLNKAAIPNCTTTKSCGLQGIFSNSGTYPSWSPYMGNVIQQAITFDQNNLFSNNTYTGDWGYMAYDTADVFNYAIWQSSPYLQDSGSTYDGQPEQTVSNWLDASTATLEEGLGKWSAWYSATPSRTAEAARSGSNGLQVNITDPFGWGVELSSPSYIVTPNNKQVSYWAKLGSGSNLRVTLQAVWLDSNNNSLRIDSIASPALDGNWQQMVLDTTPPAGTARLTLRLVHSSGTTGNTLYIDDIVVSESE